MGSSESTAGTAARGARGKRRGRAAAAVTACAVAALVTAACNTGTVTAEPSASTGPSAPATTAPTASGPASTAATTAPPSTVPAGVCATAGLQASLVNTEGAAGTSYWEIGLTNTSARRCSVRGYPGVSFLDAAEQQLGAAADRLKPGEAPGAAGANGGTVSLAPGGEAVFTLLVTSVGVLPGCESPDHTAKAFTLRIYPPDSFDPLLFAINGADGTLVCSSAGVHQLRVTTVGAI